MAMLKNIENTWTAPEGKLVTVGNNRQIAREVEDGFPVFKCYLHGSCVAQIKPHGVSGSVTVRLDDCGYLTAATIAAMGDFMRAYGVQGVASRAGGKLSVRYMMDGGEWKERKAVDGKVTFAAMRYPHH